MPAGGAPGRRLGVESMPIAGALVLSYLPAFVDASRGSGSPGAGTPAATVVVRAAGLRFHSGTVTAEDAVPSAGELAVFCRPVVTAPALPRRDDMVRAGGWLPDFVRLGELERHLGDGVIEEVVAAALEQGRLKRRKRRRIMSYPLVIRLMIAMTLMPDASYCESLRRLAGLLADVPFALAWHVLAGKVVTHWRVLVPASLMEALFWRAAGPLIADDEPSAVLLAGMMVCAADGMLVNVADTPANRKEFGCAGTAAQEGEEAAPFPAGQDRRADRPRGPCHAGRDLRPGQGRGADAAGPPGAPPSGPGRRPGGLLRPELPRL